MASKKQFQKRGNSTESHYNPKRMADFLLANASSDTRFKIDSLAQSWMALQRILHNPQMNSLP